MENEQTAVLSYEELLHENRLLKEQNISQKNQISNLLDQISYFKHQIEELKRLIFGQKRERFVPVLDNQLSLF